jgi:hypothetical protein
MFHKRINQNWRGHKFFPQSLLLPAIQGALHHGTASPWQNSPVDFNGLQQSGLRLPCVATVVLLIRRRGRKVPLQIELASGTMPHLGRWAECFGWIFYNDAAPDGAP